MKKSEVRIGGTYDVKVSNTIAPVRIVREHAAGGWVGKNIRTGREVRIKSARRLRRETSMRRQVEAYNSQRIHNHEADEGEV